MRHIGFILFAALLLGALGCGSTSEVERLRDEQTRSAEQLRSQLAALNQEVARLRQSMIDLDRELFDMRGQLDFTLGSGGGTSTTTRPRPETEIEVEVEPVVVGSLDELANIVAQLQADQVQLRAEIELQNELEDLRDPRLTWEAMNDPDKLKHRLNRFGNTWSETLQDGTTRGQFVADVEAIVYSIDEQGQRSREEQLAYYRERLTTRVNAETNPRLRQWFEQQLRMLDQENQQVVDNQLRVFQRYDTAQALQHLAEKYKISDEDLRNNGLQVYRGSYGWRQ